MNNLKRPTFNHSREDSPLTPCALCHSLMTTIVEPTPHMLELWDDRCVAVEPNTGRAFEPFAARAVAVKPDECTRCGAALKGSYKTPGDGPICVDRPACEERISCKRSFDIALRILETVRLSSREQESEWANVIIDHCHFWGDFYGPATSPALARCLAHRFLDRQGGDHEQLARALQVYGSPL